MLSHPARTQSLFLVPCLIKRSPCSPEISKLLHFSLLLQQAFLVSLDPCNVLSPLNNLFLLSFQNVVDVNFLRELSPSDSIATVWVIKIASECVDTFPFCEVISASKLCTTVSVCLHHRMWCIWYSTQINIFCQSCCPRGLALALVILEDTSWRPWPWMIKSWPWPWEKSLGLGQGQDFSPKIQATWLLYVHVLLTLTVTHESLSFLAQESFIYCM